MSNSTEDKLKQTQDELEKLVYKKYDELRQKVGINLKKGQHLLPPLYPKSASPDDNVFEKPIQRKSPVYMRRVKEPAETVKNFKIVVLDAMTLTDDHVNLNKLMLLGETTYYSFTKPEEVADRIKDANAVITNKVPMTAEAMKEAKGLVYIGVMATGYDMIDIDYCTAHSIAVTNVPNYSTAAVAQHTFALILNHFSKVAQYDNFVHNGGWQHTKLFAPCIYDTHELQNLSIGIIGFGEIGHEVAKIASAFNMLVYVYHPHPLSYKDKRHGYHRVNLNRLLCYSDIITIHCPLNDQTRNLINKKTLRKCHNDVFLINTARGAIVNSDDLYDALVNKRIGGAAIDVLDCEPMEKDCKLLKAPNLTITPHVAWGHIESRIRLMNTVYYNLYRFLTGSPTHIVNYLRYNKNEPK
ncbi:MAG: NAD(P)-dependent oxidoreductase [Acutalibacteraceae bacterium]